MELKLNIYADRLCRKVEKTVTANDFALSTGVCEDVLDIINIDMFEGGLDALSGESGQELMLDIIKNGYPFFVDLIKEIFEISDDEAKRIKVADVAVLFDTQMALCERFHLSPFQIRRERFSEFCLLVQRLRTHDKTETVKPKTKDGKEKRYIPVTDYREPKKEV